MGSASGLGPVAGGLVAAQVIKVLNGIFDPPPQHPIVPWTFGVVTVLAVPAIAAATVATTARWTGRVDASRLRDM